MADWDWNYCCWVYVCVFSNKVNRSERNCSLCDTNSAADCNYCLSRICIVENVYGFVFDLGVVDSFFFFVNESVMIAWGVSCARVIDRKGVKFYSNSAERKNANTYKKRKQVYGKFNKSGFGFRMHSCS